MISSRGEAHVGVRPSRQFSFLNERALFEKCLRTKILFNPA